MNQIRYYFEQNFIPQSLFNEEVRVVMLRMLLESGGEALFSVFNNMCKQEGEECPYSVEQFKVKPQIIVAKDEAPEFLVIKIDMPEPEDMPLASRIFLCIDVENIDVENTNPACFMVEKSFDDISALCGRDANGNHLNYGDSPETEEEQLKKVCELYLKGVGEALAVSRNI